MRRPTWHFITGEYPPQPGGVSDYSAQVARALGQAGEEVHVWAPRWPSDATPDDLVRVHRLNGRYGPRALAQLSAGLNLCPPPRRLFIQYVAGAFGFHAMNLPFCLWASARREDSIWLMFHEFAYPLGWRLKPTHNLLGLVTPIMGTLLAARANRILISTPAWELRIPSFARGAKPVTWLPVPSNLPGQVEDGMVAATRARLDPTMRATLIGHFGTYGHAAPQISRVLPELLRRDPGRLAILTGRGSVEFASDMRKEHPDLASRIVGTGGLPAGETAATLLACHILIQPYPEGVTSRRGSLMAGLALGLPIVTNDGEATESLWREEGVVALAPSPSTGAIIREAEGLLSSPERWSDLARAAKAAYEARFSLARSLETIRALAVAEDARLDSR